MMVKKKTWAQDGTYPLENVDKYSNYFALGPML
jgi:hypothetical protein